MDMAVKAALSVLGLNELPKTQDELKAVYRRQVKKAHPDRFGGHTDSKPFHRVKRANEVLSAAIDEGEKPCIRVKFGDGDSHPAKVAKNVLVEYEPARECKFIVALKWFMGLSIQVENGEWHEIAEPESFALGGVWVHFVD